MYFTSRGGTLHVERGYYSRQEGVLFTSRGGTIHVERGGTLHIERGALHVKRGVATQLHVILRAHAILQMWVW